MFLKSIFPGNSKIISFVKDFVSPSKLRIVEAPYNSNGYAFDDFDLVFPSKLRKLRFEEVIEKSEITVKKVDL
jgi:hypothetical protein